MIPPIGRFFETALYAVLNFLPYMLLALAPFHKSLRFSRTTTTLLVLFATLLQIPLYLTDLIIGIPAPMLTLLGAVLDVATCFLLIRATPGKIFFLFLLLSNVANLLSSLSKCIEGLLFHSLALESYHLSHSLLLLCLALVTVPLLYLYMRRYYAAGFAQSRQGGHWRYLWLIPLTFYFIWFYHLYSDAHGSDAELLLHPSQAIFLLIVNLGALLVYQIIARFALSMEETHRLSEENHLLEMQNLQFESLRDRIDEARRAKHDVRHHITLLDSYAEQGDLVGLRTYLATYRRSLPDDRSIVLCKNVTLNALLLYYAQQAKNVSTDYDVPPLDIPETLPFADTTLSVILGNLLENAVEAQASVPEDARRITVRASFSQGALLLTVENTYAGEVRTAKDGSYLSTKNNRRGVGLSSVRSIVESTGGKIEVSHTDTHFTVTVFLAS